MLFRSRVLLFRDSDLGLNPVPHWWMTPGGGVDPGESDLEAAVRELHEETGLAVDAGALFGPVATRRVVHGYSDVIVDQDEVFFGVRTTGFAPDSSGYTEEEAACIVATEWLTRDDVTAASEPVWPADLVMLWDHWEAMTGDPGLAGLALPDTEESTVPSEGPQPV